MTASPTAAAYPAFVREKLRSLDELAAMRSDWKQAARTMVWTNGFFEVLHAGHIEFLIKAARLGNVCVVGVNSDASVASAKGTGHPVTPLEERVLVLSAVEAVDYITVFDEPTCVPLLERLRPEVYAKGMHHVHGGLDADERAVVEAAGGCIALIAGDPAKSTDAILGRIRAGEQRQGR